MSPLGREESSWTSLMLTSWMTLSKIQYLSDFGLVTYETGVMTQCQSLL